MTDPKVIVLRQRAARARALANGFTSDKDRRAANAYARELEDEADAVPRRLASGRA